MTTPASAEGKYQVANHKSRALHTSSCNKLSPLCLYQLEHIMGASRASDTCLAPRRKGTSEHAEQIL